MLFILCIVIGLLGTVWILVVTDGDITPAALWAILFGILCVVIPYMGASSSGKIKEWETVKYQKEYSLEVQLSDVDKATALLLVSTKAKFRYVLQKSKVKEYTAFREFLVWPMTYPNSKVYMRWIIEPDE